MEVFQLMIGIIGAMPIEIESIKKFMNNVKCESFSHIKFFIGKINNTDCVLSICGPGKVNAAICTQIMALKYNPKIIINTGIAGALEKNIQVGDIVLADSVVQHDMDTTAVGDEYGFISGLNLINLPCSKTSNEKIKSVAIKLKEKIHSGIIATGDQFISSKEKLSHIKNTFNALACDMEAGSIGHACFVNRIPFVALRVISDNADEKSHISYEKFKVIAANKTTQLILNFISTF